MRWYRVTPARVTIYSRSSRDPSLPFRPDRHPFPFVSSSFCASPLAAKGNGRKCNSTLRKRFQEARDESSGWISRLRLRNWLGLSVVCFYPRSNERIPCTIDYRNGIFISCLEEKEIEIVDSWTSFFLFSFFCILNSKTSPSFLTLCSLDHHLSRNSNGDSSWDCCGNLNISLCLIFLKLF